MSNIADWDFYVRLGLQSSVAAVRWPHVGYLVHPRGMAHDVRTSEREYRYLDVKYARERRSRGVTLNEEDWKLYLAGLAYNGGQRLTGIRIHADLLVRHQRWRSFRSVIRGLVPDAVRPATPLKWQTPAPADWQHLTEKWLEPCRHGWLD